MEDVKFEKTEVFEAGFKVENGRNEDSLVEGQRMLHGFH